MSKFEVGDKVLCIYPRGDIYIGHIVKIDANYSSEFPIELSVTKYRTKGGPFFAQEDSALTTDSECTLYSTLSDFEKAIYDL